MGRGEASVYGWRNGAPRKALDFSGGNCRPETGSRPDANGSASGVNEAVELSEFGPRWQSSHKRSDLNPSEKHRNLSQVA